MSDERKVEHDMSMDGIYKHISEKKAKRYVIPEEWRWLETIMKSDRRPDAARQKGNNV